MSCLLLWVLTPPPHFQKLYLESKISVPFAFGKVTVTVTSCSFYLVNMISQECLKGIALHLAQMLTQTHGYTGSNLVIKGQKWRSAWHHKKTQNLEAITELLFHKKHLKLKEQSVSLQTNRNVKYWGLMDVSTHFRLRINSLNDSWQFYG